MRFSLSSQRMQQLASMLTLSAKGKACRGMMFLSLNRALMQSAASGYKF